MYESNEISLPHFKHWLKQQDPKTEYVYGSNRDCLIARYLKAHGLEGVSVGGYEGRFHRDGATVVYFNIPDKLASPLHANGRTYGDVLAALQ